MAQNPWVLTVVVVLAFVLCSCGKNINKAVDDWLQTHTAPALVDVSGEWDGGQAMAGGWGGGDVYYTAKLKKSGDDAYRGKAVEGAVIGTKEAESATLYPIVLERMK